MFGDKITSMKAKHRIEENDEALSLGLILSDQVLFSEYFQKNDLSLEMTIPQKCMAADNSRRILLCTSRNVGKTVVLIGRIMRLIATYIPKYEDRRDEALVFTPAEAHLTPLIDRLFANLNSNPFFRSLIVSQNKGDKPKLVTKTNLTILARIEGSSGTDTNMVGIHGAWIFGDEVEYSDMVNHRSRVGGAMPETKWIYCGVPNGVRGTPFYSLDQTKEGRGWSRHKFSMLTANPRFLTSKKYRKEMTDAFGGKTSPDYITQVKGEWGDEALSSFPPGSVSWNTELPYYICNTTNQSVLEHLANNSLPSLLRIPQVQCMKAVVGWDWGYSPDPGTFVLAVKYSETDSWKTYARVTMYQVALPKQIEILKYIWTFVLNHKGVMISIDSPECYQMLLAEENRYLFDGKVKLTNQAGTAEMDTITGKIVTESMQTDPEVVQHRKDGKVIKVRRKYFLTEQWRRAMSNHMLKAESELRIEMAYDSELESELLSTVERKMESGYTTYEVPKGKGLAKITLDQTTDAMRAAVDSIIEVESQVLKEPFDYAAMMSSLGWAGRKNQDDPFKPAWET